MSGLTIAWSMIDLHYVRVLAIVIQYYIVNISLA